MSATTVRSRATTTDGRSPVGPPRDLALDRFRGALVFLMVAGNYLAGIAFVPAFLKHAPDIGLTVADLVAPAFVFAIGLTYGTSFARRARRGLAGAYRHFLLRYLSLVGIGAIISAGARSVVDEPKTWDVLEALGVAGLLCLPLIRLGSATRFAVGLLLLAGYQWLLDSWALESVLGSSHGGLIGSLSWSALLILSTAVADVWRMGMRSYLVCCACLTVLATLAVFVVPVSKNRVSLSFVLVALALSAVAWLLVDRGSRAAARPAGYLCCWGENALALYLLHLLLLGVVALPLGSWWYAEASVPLAVLQLLTLLGAMSVAARWLHRRGLRLGL